VPAEIAFGLLGPMTVYHRGVPVPIPRGKQRVLLAALLLNAGRTLSVDELNETLWGAAPPASAKATLQNYVKRLRASLGDADHRRIGLVPPGYLMRLEPGELDVHSFESLLDAGRNAARAGAWERAARQFRDALSLWRGEALDGVGSPVLELREVPRLTEMRMQATEARIEADLYLSRHADVTAELRKLADAHPLRERLHKLLMLALYRDGRQGDALAAYQAVRRILIDELGTEPGTELRGLHQRILAQDATLAAPEPSPVPVSVRVPAGQPKLVPRQLPMATWHFTGRAEELKALTDLLDIAEGNQKATFIEAVSGMPGIGKTALALHWAHMIADRFPDGQLYVNLRGYDPLGVPTEPGAVIRGFLGAFQVPPEAVPAEIESQAALYRSVLAGRRILIVLDNAHDADQVRPLLPGTPGCLVLVTSRQQLSSLIVTEGAHALTLGLLTVPEARKLLVARLGAGRIDGEQAAADELITLCGRLPLALAITAARAVARPASRLAALARELHEERHRLDALDTGEPPASIRMVFSWSFESLGTPAARMFGLLGVHPGPDISVPAAASLAAVSPHQARQALTELTRVQLLAEQPAGRYYLHDLLRAYAVEQARGQPEDERRAAERRMLDHYLHTSHAVSRLLDPAKDREPLPSLGSGVLPEQPSGYEDSLAWAEAEHLVLLSAIARAASGGFDVHAVQIPLALEMFLLRRGYWHDLASTQRTALYVATRAGDLAGQARCHHALGRVCALLNSLPQGRSHLTQALDLYGRLGDRIAQARAHIDMGFALAEHGCYSEAIGHAEQARDLFRAVGNRAGHATALNNIGWNRIELGDYGQAIGSCEQALAAFRDLGDRYGEAAALDTVGYAHHHVGDRARAAARFREALALFHDLGDRYNQANVLVHLGENYLADDDPGAAHGALDQARAILEDLNHSDVGKVHAMLRAVEDASVPSKTDVRPLRTVGRR
jgi:DNA-binding SARP family transcriptional activator/tetratricopeptide (TPR) repeat protein